MCILGSLLLDPSHPHPQCLFPFRCSLSKIPARGCPIPQSVPAPRLLCSPYLATCSLGGGAGLTSPRRGGTAWMRGSSQRLGGGQNFSSEVRRPGLPFTEPRCSSGG